MSRRRHKTAPARIWRCGNFVIRRVEVPTYGEGEWLLSREEVRRRVISGEMGTVETHEVLSLDGAWCVRLMPGSHMEVLLGAMLGEEEAVDNEWVTLVCSNLFTASAIPNGHYHQALMLLTAAYADPTLVSGSPLSRKRRAYIKDVKRVRDAFVRWRKDYDEYLETIPDDDEHEIRKMEAESILSGGNQPPSESF